MSWAVIDDLQKDRIKLETTGLLQLEASLYYIALEALPGWTPVNDVSGGAWTDINRSGIDDGLVVTALGRAAVGMEPEVSRFNVEVDGRKLGDIRQNGTVNIVDALAYLEYSNGVLADQDEIDYIEDVMKPYMIANPATYQDYYAGETVWTDITT